MLCRLHLAQLPASPKKRRASDPRPSLKSAVPCHCIVRKLGPEHRGSATVSNLAVAVAGARSWPALPAPRIRRTAQNTQYAFVSLPRDSRRPTVSMAVLRVGADPAAPDTTFHGESTMSSPARSRQPRARQSLSTLTRAASPSSGAAADGLKARSRADNHSQQNGGSLSDAVMIIDSDDEAAQTEHSTSPSLKPPRLMTPLRCRKWCRP